MFQNWLVTTSKRYLLYNIWYAEDLALDTSGSYSHVKRIEQLNTVFWNMQFWIIFNSYFLKSSST